MTRDEPHIVGVLLAAGLASRFGAPKQLAILEDRPLMEYALDALLAVEDIDEAIVVVGAHADDVEAAVVSFGWGELARTVRCPDFEDGLSASLRCGVLAAQERGADAIVVHLADLPRIGPDAVEAVLDHALGEDGRPGAAPTRASYGGRDGHPVVFPAAWFARLTSLDGDAGAGALLAGPQTQRLEVGHLADPTDVDTPDQLEALQP